MLIFLGSLLLPTRCLPQFRLAGNFSSVPVPESGTDCGLSGALSVMVMAAVRSPFPLGVKTTPMVQWAPGATLVPQVLVWLKSVAFVPVTAMLVICNVRLPVLVRVTVWLALGLRTVCKGKDK